jgi:hypothetical protein
MDEMEVRPVRRRRMRSHFCHWGQFSIRSASDSGDIAGGSELSDARDLSPQDEKRWRQVFLSFLASVLARGMRRPMILKSPTHGFRIAPLRDLLPDARFVLIVRTP